MEKTKEWLKRGWEIDLRIKELLAEKEKALTMATSITSQATEEMVDSSKGNSSETKFINYADYSALIDETIDKLIETKKEILEAIILVEEISLQRLLVLRYITFDSWDDIADKMSYEHRYIHKLHSKALMEIKNIRNKK